MDLKSIMDYCLSKEGAVLEFPFGEVPAVIKVKRKIFAELYAGTDKPQITLKCEPLLASLLREKYPDVVVPGYHVPNRNKPYWNTVRLGPGAVSDNELLELIDHSYKEVIRKVK